MSAKTTHNVVHRPGFTPLERIILTADGNLQRMMSAYLNDEVVLEMIRFERTPGSNNFDREINLKVQGKVFCNAQSQLVVSSPKILCLLEEQGFGLGQLFASLGLLPVFRLISCGKTTEILFRKYALEIDGMTCTITEVFPADLFTSEYDVATKNFTQETWEKVHQEVSLSSNQVS